MRKYELRYHCAKCVEEVRDFCPKYGREIGEWYEVPSVTTVLDILHKPALTWWGQGIGIKGLLQLQHYPGIEWDTLKDADADGITDLLRQHKLTVNHVRDDASRRGSSVHAALEGWAKTGEIPVATIFPPDERPYVEGLALFLQDIGEVANIETEVMVGSLKHGFAGRYDIALDVTGEREIAYKTTPVRGRKYATLQPGRYMLDLKTSKGTYLSHHRQLAAYEMASVECGYPPTVAQGILHVTEQGSYELVRGLAEPDDFVVILEAFKSDAGLNQRYKERKK